MGIFGSVFGKKIAEGKANLKKIENKDLMEAVVAACVLVSYADGECEEKELKATEDLIRANEQLKHFGAEITETTNRFDSIMRAGPRVGKMKLMREITDVKADQQQKEEVFLTALTIAEADGEIEPAELQILKEIGQAFGLSLKDYGIAA